MQDRPTAEEILSTIGDLLEHQVLEVTSGPLKHQVRVAGNLCRILERELAERALHEPRARARLSEVLDLAPDDARDVAALNEELAQRIRSEDDVDLERRAWPAVVEIVRDKLSANKPGHDDYDYADEGER